MYKKNSPLNITKNIIYFQVKKDQSKVNTKYLK